MSPKFDEMAKVLVKYESGPLEGYVIGSELKDGRWIYKISHPDPDEPEDSFDNWMPEEALEQIR